MTDSERIQELQEQNQMLLEKMDLIEQALKALLMNDVLKDAQKAVWLENSVESEKVSKFHHQKIQVLRDEINYFENKLRTMLEKQVRILPECTEYYDNGLIKHEMTETLKQNTYQVTSYDFGMYQLLCKDTPKIWVSFDMVARIV